MRLDDFDPNDVDVEDQRGGGGGFQMPIGGGGFPLGGGRLGCGSIALLLVIAVVFKVNPLSLLGGMPAQAPTLPGQPGTGGYEQAAPAAAGGGAASCRVNQASLESCNALSSLNKTWKPLVAEVGASFSRPKLVFYAQAGRSGCGAAQSAMGPFYCPSDNGIYLDTDFYQQLEQQLGAGGQFARDYVIAHEYGHHIQNLLGTSDEVHKAQEQNPGAANRLSVRLELQADCYAGVWAARNRDRLESGDMQSGLNAAHQIGDDTLQKGAGQNPNEASFTHGSSAQRMEWLKKGLDSGDLNACDTFADLRR
ncbi:MAG: neutral zinc metallopeptidase [Sphingomonadales bacterium]|nr:neutral zinc metallopeptidase [Sphingomonadales bacterium]